MAVVVARQRVAAVAILGVFAAVFLAVALPRAAAPFGDSHDGRNAAQWALGTAAIREEGVVESRLGAVRGDGSVYANHPPLIYAATAASESVAGERPLATRLPAVLASLAAVGLLFALVRQRGVPPVPAATGVVLALGAPMFVVYGAMLDTPMLGFPLAILLLLWWDRARSAGTPRPVAVAVTACAASLASWEASLLTAVLAITGLIVDRGRPGRRASVAAIGGMAAGTALIGLWQLAVHRSLGPIAHELLRRSGTEGGTASLLTSLDNQQAWLRDTFSEPVLAAAVAGLVVALHDTRTRAVTAASLVTCLTYALVLHDGAAFHDYWSYWLLLPFGLGFGVGVERFLRATRQAGVRTAVSGGVVSILVGGLVVASASGASGAALSIETGQAAGRLVAGARYPAEQGVAWYVGEFAEPLTWLAYATGREPAAVDGLDELRQLARQRPDDLVLVSTACLAEQRGRLCRVLGFDGESTDRYRLVSAGELLAE